MDHVRHRIYICPVCHITYFDEDERDECRKSHSTDWEVYALKYWHSNEYPCAVILYSPSTDRYIKWDGLWGCVQCGAKPSDELGLYVVKENEW